MTLPTSFWYLISPTGGTQGVKGAILWPIWPKISFFGHLVVLDGLQSLHLDCWPTSNVGIGSHWPYQWVLDTWYDTQGGHISYLVVLDKPQSLRFDRWTSANVERGSHWPYQFLMLYITHRGSLGVMGVFSGGRFDQNLIFWSFCCTRWSSIPKFGLLSNF